MKPQRIRAREANFQRSPEPRNEDQTVSLPTELLAFVNEAKWTYAKTMPKWPHEYIVPERVDEALFERLVRHIRTHRYEGRFYQNTGIVECDKCGTSVYCQLLGKCTRKFFECEEYVLRANAKDRQ